VKPLIPIKNLMRKWEEGAHADYEHGQRMLQALSQQQVFSLVSALREASKVIEFYSTQEPENPNIGLMARDYLAKWGFQEEGKC